MRDATQFGAGCPQALTGNPFLPPGKISEDCLNLNVDTPTPRSGSDRPVLVWIHGGGLVQDGGRSFADRGNPSTRALPWPPVGNRTKVLSFVPLQSKVTTDFAAAHHCSFWAAG